MSSEPMTQSNKPATLQGLALQLKNSEKLFSLLVQSVKDYGIFMLDPAGLIATWNEGAQRITGYSAEEVTGKHFAMFYTPDAVASNHPQHELELAIRDGRYEEEGWRIRRDGSRFWANVTITAVYDGDTLIGFAKVTRDLSDRKHNEVFETLVKSVRDYAIFMLDPNGNVQTWNEGARRLKGYTAEEIIGKHFSNFYPDAVKQRKHPQYELEVAKREWKYEEEGWRVRKDGTTFWANVLITALRDPQGKLIGFAKVTRDLTERKKAEEIAEQSAKRLAETNDELQRLAYVVSHELQSPISTISRYQNLIAVRYKDKLGSDAVDFFTKIDHSTKLIARMIDDLWNYARVARPNVEHEPVPMDSALQEALRDLEGDLADEELVVATKLPIIEASRSQMVFVLRELVRNAVRYRGIEPPRIVIDAKAEEDGWTFSVQDNGIGVDPVYFNDVFKLFHRLDAGPEPSATGMGLAMCRRIVQQHCGRIAIDSKLGGGTTISFWLPAKQPARCTN
jgi:PAS domain S-box-containing protein